MQHIEVGTARLATWDSGGDGPALIALHAGVADSRVWDGCIPAWVGAGWRVITYDRRGFGRSTWQPEPFSHIADLVAVLDALDVSSGVLVGNSMGGRVALDATLAAPDRVAALVLVGAGISGAPWPFGTPGDPVEAEIDEAAGAAAEAGDLAEANRLEAHMWLDGPRQAEGRVGGVARALFLDMNGIALAADGPGTASWEEASWDRLAEVAVPTQVVISEHDETVINEWCREVATRIPPASLVELADRAHLPMLEDPEGFVTALDPFLGGVLRDLQAGGATPPNPA